MPSFDLPAPELDALAEYVASVAGRYPPPTLPQPYLPPPPPPPPPRVATASGRPWAATAPS